VEYVGDRMSDDDRKFIEDFKKEISESEAGGGIYLSDVTRLFSIIESMQSRIEEQAKETNMLEEALLFYADPETYFAIGFFSDPPCGEFMTDFEDLPEFEAWKPGKRAREAARNYLAILDKKKKELETQLRDRSEFGLTRK